MFRCTFLILCLALGNEILCTAATTTLATSELVKTVPIAASTAATNVAQALPKTTPAALTTTTTTPAAPTTTTPAAPTTTTPAAPTTTTPAAPTTTTPAAPTTTTTAVPTTTTTAVPTTNTTAVPTSTTTPATVPTTTPATVPTPAPLPTPTVGNYSVKPSINKTACLMADFGLRIGYKQGVKVVNVNLDPHMTNFTGACGVNSSSLLLTSDNLTILFNFSKEGNKFHLHGLNVTLKQSTGAAFVAANANLSLWAAAVGSSYMCNKEQKYNITATLTLYTFGLRVQPFGVDNGLFSTAHECSMDDTSILIPIIVGAALAGLILIVVIAYVIGRRKTYVGYQTL